MLGDEDGRTCSFVASYAVFELKYLERLLFWVISEEEEYASRA